MTYHPWLKNNQTSSPYSSTSSYSSSSPNSIQDINNNDNNNSPTAAVHNTPTPTLYRKNHHGSRTNYTPSSTTNKNITPSFNFNNNNNNSDNNNNNINAPRLLCSLLSHSGPVLALRFSFTGTYLASIGDDTLIHSSMSH